MGKLRVETTQDKIGKKRYQELKKTLIKASAIATSKEVHIFYDLASDEVPKDVHKEFQYVAKIESIDVIVKRVPKRKSLSFVFPNAKYNHTSGKRQRLSAQEAKARILRVLKEAPKPLKKSTIIKQTGISPGTWNLRATQLLNDGLITRQGTRRDTTYSIAPD